VNVFRLDLAKRSVFEFSQQVRAQQGLITASSCRLELGDRRAPFFDVLAERDSCQSRVQPVTTSFGRLDALREATGVDLRRYVLERNRLFGSR
jgi:hypothetical protein